jgi:hypothetical protein
MQIRGALLGDMAPGSLLDVVGGNVPDFQTLAAAPVSESYGAFRLDLPALYATLLRAMKAGMPPDKGAAAGMMIDSMVAAQTGMRPAELLSLFTGEIGASSNEEQGPNPDSLNALLMLPITKSEALIGLLRRVAAPLFANEERISGATVVKIGPIPAGTATGTAGKKNLSFLLAVSPNMLVISSDRAQLEGVLARGATGAAAPVDSLAADAKFRSVRKSLRPELNGISYTDISRVKWDNDIAALQQKLAQQRQQLVDRAALIEKGDEKTPPDPTRAAQLRKQAEQLSGLEPILTALVPLMKKHLKVSAGGSWKASDGMFFDSFMN